MIVAPTRPAAIHVDIADGIPTRRKRMPEEDRDRPPRSQGRQRRPKSAPKREGPPVRQLYPPPDQEASFEEADENGNAPSDRPPKATMGRPVRGPMMRPSDAPPIAKGKVRQLYPPPAEPEDMSASLEDAQSYERAIQERVIDDSDEASDSVFISDPQELEERRQRARERGQSRREPPSAEADVPGGESRSQSDEWPAF